MNCGMRRRNIIKMHKMRIVLNREISKLNYRIHKEHKRRAVMSVTVCN